LLRRARLFVFAMRVALAGVVAGVLAAGVVVVVRSDQDATDLVDPGGVLT
jgi:hypothetical protein